MNTPTILCLRNFVMLASFAIIMAGAATAQSTGTMTPTVSTQQIPYTNSIHCKSDSVQLGVILNGSEVNDAVYSWSTGQSGSSIRVLPHQTTTYELTTYIPHLFLSITDTFVVAVDHEPLVADAPSVITGPTACPGDPVQLYVTAKSNYPGYHVQWNTGQVGQQITVKPQTSGTYTATVTDECGWETIDLEVKVTLSEHEPLQIASLENIDLDCPNAEVILAMNENHGSGGVGSGYVFSWTNWKDANPVLEDQPSKNQTYTVQMTDRCYQDTVSATLSVAVHDYTEPQLSLTEDQVICFGSEAELLATVSGGVEPYNISWTTGDVGADVVVSPGRSTTYYAVLHDACNTMVAAATNVDVSQPHAAFSYQYLDETTVQFVNNSSNDVTNFIWDFGGSEEVTVKNPQRKFSALSDLSVTLTAASEAGCEDVAEIEIDAPVNMYLPTGFSPNGDGVNDQFKMGLYGTVENFHIEIYNRWGQMIFTADDPAFIWDGRSFDGTSQIGNYTYKLRAEGNSGQIIKRTGTVTVIAR